MDALGRITKQTDALNRTTTITRDAQGNPTQITRPNGAVTTMSYDAKGNLFTSTEQAINATTTFTYEPTFNQVTSIRDPKGNLTQIAYDAKGNPLTITDALNQVTTFTYNPQGLLLTTKDALNQTTTFTYDALGRLLTTTDPLNRTTTLTYDPAGNVATSTDALNRITTFAYDVKNRLTQVTDPNSGVTRYAYDGNGNLLTVTDAKNQVTTFVYDSRNRLLSSTDPLGKVETYTYDGNDNLTKRRTPKGDDILFAYDPVNQLLSKTLPGSQVTSYAYDLVGNLTNVTDPDSVVAMSYDQANRLTAVTTDGSSHQPAVTLSYAYDQSGNRVSLTEGTRTTSYHYDGLNRLVALGAGATVAPPAANLVSWWKGEGTGADEQGANPGILRNGVSFATGMVGQAFRFDGVDDEIGVTGTVGRFGFQATIDLLIKTTSTRRETLLSDRLTCAVTSPANAASWELQLQANGTVVFSAAGPDSNTGTTFVGVGVATTRAVNDGQWHRIGAVRNGTTQLIYLDGQLQGSWNYLNGPPVLTSLPAGGLRIGTGGCGTSPFTGQLDEITIADRAWTVAELQTPRLHEQPNASWSYDALSRRTALTLPNGIQTTYTYDPASQVTNILHQLTATSSQINKADYVYNNVGNRTSLTDRRGLQSFSYDPLDRLTSASHPLLLDPQVFAYDAVGNRTTGGSVVNVGNQLTADANFGYLYDDNGNLTRKTLLATGNYTQYMYDAENRLTKVEDFAAGNPTPTFTSTYRYDGLGRRIEKVANGQTTRYIYDGEDILLEYDGSNVLQARYTHGPGIDEPLSRTVVTSGVSSGVTAVLASTADGLRGPVVDDTIVVNGQIYLGFVSGSSFLPPVGQSIETTGSHLPVAPIDVTAAANSGTLTVALVDTATLSGNAPVYLVLREQATGRVLESQLLFAARLTASSTAQPGLPTVIAATTVPISTATANGTLFYHQDGLGSVTELTDSTGSVAKAYAYDAYGNILESPGTVEQPYTYTGREFDSETGLYYYRARYYDAGTGRFLQKDPIGLRGGLNVFRYVDNNPNNWTDATGLTKKDKTYGLPSDFWKWYHRQQKRPGDPDLNQDAARDLYEEWKRQGRPDPEGHKTESDRNSENEPYGYCPLNDPVPPIVVVPAPDDQLPDNVFGIDPRNPRIPRIPGRLIIPAPRFIIP
ncbi:MAG: hypothetical protein IT391_06010 [Nitrospira sp.]|nr:hypothetical protein [Nitrospira sp.]